MSDRNDIPRAKYIGYFENEADLFLISCSVIIETSFFVKDAEFSQAFFEILLLC